jgi:hypothetical protein
MERRIRKKKNFPRPEKKKPFKRDAEEAQFTVTPAKAGVQTLSM